MKFLKKYLIIFTLLLFFISCQNNQLTKIDKYQKIADETITDTRVEIFDIESVDGKIKIKTSNSEVFNKITNLSDQGIEVHLLPAKDLEKQSGIINLSVANIRKTYRHGSSMETQGIFGTPIRIYEKKGSWYRIQTPDNYIGWADGAGVHPMTDKEIQKWHESEKVIFTDYNGFVYSGTDCNGDVVSDIVLGNMLKYINKTGNFYKVEFPDGRLGYIKESQAELFSKWYNKIELSGDNLVNLSMKFMGIPYLWGGTSYKAMDCSGFVKTLYQMHGVILQRDASQQALYGEEVPLVDNYSHLQKGDLLFFGSEKSITHVGMYIGNMKYIHEAGRVKINSLSKGHLDYSKYRESSLVVARRIIGSLETKGIETFSSNKFFNQKEVPGSENEH